MIILSYRLCISAHTFDWIEQREYKLWILFMIHEHPNPTRYVTKHKNEDLQKISYNDSKKCRFETKCWYRLLLKDIFPMNKEMFVWNAGIIIKPSRTHLYIPNKKTYAILEIIQIIFIRLQMFKSFETLSWQIATT